MPRRPVRQIGSWNERLASCTKAMLVNTMVASSADGRARPGLPPLTSRRDGLSAGSRSDVPHGPATTPSDGERQHDLKRAAREAA